MPGFLIANASSDFTISNYDNSRCAYGELSFGNWKVARNSLNKFMDDKLLMQDERFVVITEGVILNKLRLFKKYNCADLFELIVKMQTENIAFYNEFRGSFSGAVYDKAEGTWNIYTNHYGDNAVYYYSRDGLTLIGSDINYLISYLKTYKIHYTMNEKALYYLLTYGFMGDDSTVVSEIQRLAPGGAIGIAKDGSLTISEYYRLCKGNQDLSNWTDGQLIDRLDELFRDAIRLEYEKDIECGYEHVTDLSGGLDSRMNAWVAHDMGYHNITNISYAQSGSVDEIVSKQIAQALHTQHIFYPLDSAECVMDIDTNVQMTGGSVLYSSITGGKKVLENLEPNKFGIEHTGQIGDVVIGTFLTSPSECDKNEVGGMYSYLLQKRITEKPLDIYQDYEQYLFYVRLFRGTLSSHAIRRNFVEVASPFLNIEFLEFCLSIPIEKRIDHRLYFKWVKSKYPKAAKFVWEKRGVNLFAPKWLEYLHRAIHNGPNKLLRILHRDKPTPTGMNPIDYWYATNPSLKQYLDGYFKKNIASSVISQELKKEMTVMYQNESALGKTQVLTVLSVVKQYFN